MEKDKLLNQFNTFFDDHRKKISISIAVLGLCFFIFKNIDSKEPSSKKTARPTPLETYIPEGMTLVPIEVMNLQQLQSLIDDRAIVDLFAPNRKSPVAESLKLVRSPMDPNIYAVLVKDELSKQILEHGYQFIVVVKNRNSRHAPKQKVFKRKILFGDAS